MQELCPALAFFPSLALGVSRTLFASLSQHQPKQPPWSRSTSSIRSQKGEILADCVGQETSASDWSAIVRVVSGSQYGPGVRWVLILRTALPRSHPSPHTASLAYLPAYTAQPLISETISWLPWRRVDVIVRVRRGLRAVVC